MTGGVKTVRLVLVGAGRAMQAIHLPRLQQLTDLFDVVALVEPDDAVRAAVAARLPNVQLARELHELDLRDADAILCATPVHQHTRVTLAAVAAGCHVLCEKPLALTVPEVAAIEDARRQAGVVVQVAYMKRYDPSVEALMTQLPDEPTALRYIEATTHDPDQTVLLDHVRVAQPDERPPWMEHPDAHAQIDSVVGNDSQQATRRSYARGFASSLIHDVNLLHAMLRHVGEPTPAKPASAAVFADGTGVSLNWDLAGGGHVHATHLNLPGVNAYQERISAYVNDRVIELVFGSPYLPNAPARLSVTRSHGRTGFTRTEIVVSSRDAFVEQLRHFHSAVTTGAAVRTPPLEAADDLIAVQRAHRHCFPDPRRTAASHEAMTIVHPQ